MRTAAASVLPTHDASLCDVSFVVLDVETTGGSPEEGVLIEVAAAAFRGGALLATFESLVDPGCALPPFISELTGITDAMVSGAPAAPAVMPALLSIIGDAVVVGHNVEFDLGFVGAALAGCGRPPLANVVVDTLALARRLVRDEATSCALGALAAALRLEHRPAHRALADVLTTADLLHRLIEVATGYGVLHLGELLELPARLAPIPLSAAGSLAPA